MEDVMSYYSIIFVCVIIVVVTIFMISYWVGKMAVKNAIKEIYKEIKLGIVDEEIKLEKIVKQYAAENKDEEDKKDL